MAYPVYAVSVGGSSVQVKPGTLSMTSVANGRDTVTATLLSWDGSLAPAFGATVTVTEDATTIFGGVLLRVTRAGVAGRGVKPTELAIEASGYKSYAERRYVTEEIPTGSVKAALQVLDDYLTPYGVSLDAAQATGPTIEALSFNHLLLSECLSQISALSGWVWEIDAAKKLRMFDPASTAAPWNVTAGDGHILGDVVVEPSQVPYANRVYLSYGASTNGLVARSDTFTGNGSATSWTLSYQLVSSTGYVTVNGVAETLGTGATWTYNAATNAITRTSPVTNGHAIVIGYNTQFPQVVQVDDAAEQAAVGLWEAIAPDQPNVSDADVAESIAQAFLDISVARPRTVRFQTGYTGEIKPGSTLTITLPLRGLTGTWMVTEVAARNTTGNLVRRFVTAVEGTTFAGTWRQAGSPSGPFGPRVTSAPTPEVTQIVGQTGPQGPTGATGATGSAGAKGDKGDKGDPGDDGTVITEYPGETTSLWLMEGGGVNTVTLSFTNGILTGIS